MFPPIPHPANENPGVLLAVPNPQFNAHFEDIPQPVGHIAQGTRAHGHHNIVVANHGMVNYHHDAATQYANVGHAHGIYAQAQPNAAEDQGHDIFGHVHPVAPVPVQAAFHDPFGHQIPFPVQPAAGNLQRLVDRYLHDPDSQVDLVSMEPGAAGRFKVLIILDVTNIL